MALVQIKLDQAAAPAGVPGSAREDLVTGLAVTATAVGGPFVAYLWSLVHKPINIFTASRASTAVGTPGAAATILTPIDVPGTYLLRLLIDSGLGLGAGVDDVAEITFYAGIPADVLNGPLNSDPGELPRRRMAFGETDVHNVADALDPSGNPEGWSREWYRWFGVLQRLYEAKSWAAGRVALTGGGAALTRGFNVSGVNRVSQGVVDVSFLRPLPDNKYVVNPTPRGSAGMMYVDSETTAGFRVYRADIGGALLDDDFNFNVKLGV